MQSIKIRSECKICSCMCNATYKLSDLYKVARKTKIKQINRENNQPSGAVHEITSSLFQYQSNNPSADIGATAFNLLQQQKNKPIS